MNWQWTFTDDYGATYAPWTDGARVGFQVERNGVARYLTILPSSGSDEVGDATSCAFLREGPTADDDDAVTWVALFDQHDD